MPTATLTLTKFLLARIAEDEAIAQVDKGELERGCWPASEAPPMADPDRVLAECVAKRAIVAMGGSRCGDDDEDFRAEFAARFGVNPSEHYPSGYASGCDGCSAAESVDADHRRTLAHLASVYADHADYRDEWRP